MKKFMLAAALVASPAMAQDWTYVAGSSDGTTKISIDYSTIMHGTAASSAVLKVNLPSKNTAIITTQVQCDVMTYRDLKVTQKDPYGNSLNLDEELTLDWKAPPKGSVIEGALQAICTTNKRILK